MLIRSGSDSGLTFIDRTREVLLQAIRADNASVAAALDPLFPLREAGWRLLPEAEAGTSHVGKLPVVLRHPVIASFVLSAVGAPAALFARNLLSRHLALALVTAALALAPAPVQAHDWCDSCDRTCERCKSRGPWTGSRPSAKAAAPAAGAPAAPTEAPPGPPPPTK